ncbi:hypothetical protein PIB30_048132 [Stylosanthes scabra]|uniref:Uncharacterized protein n=1 Tax=Stylosanthes scabra TaxID=79078 RepID=A0ABU6TI91_9FABA|nr:hypothetical protein [Stylosanthes scabra]
MIEAMARGCVKMLKEDVIQKDEEEELEESCCAEQKNQKKGPDKTYEKPPAEYPSVTGMLDEIEQILYHDKGADTHLMASRKVYPPPSRFSRRLASLRARRARDEAGPANAAPQEDEVIDVSSDSDSEQVPEYVSGEEQQMNKTMRKSQNTYREKERE